MSKEFGKTGTTVDATGSSVVFFCVRADSDADHLVPVVDALARRGQHAIRVVIYDPIKTYQDDYRFRYLKDTYGISPEHVLDLPEIPVARRLRLSLVRRAFAFILYLQRRYVGVLPQGATRRPLQRLQTYLSKNTRNEIASSALISEILKHDRGLVVFDHTMNTLTQAVSTAVRKHGFAMAALPHSVPHVASLLRDPATGKSPTPDKSWADFFDVLAVPNELSVARLTSDGTPREMVAVLGSARFGTEWGQTLDRIAPKYDWVTEKPKIAFILSKHGPYVDWPGVNDVVAELTRAGRAAVVLKPHPRTEISGLPSARESDFLRLAGPDTPTCSLIQWADLVVFWGSSVIYDALRLRKPALHLAYLIRLDFDFETYVSNWRVESPLDLKVRLDSFLETRSETFSEDEAAACLAALVGDEQEQSIAERYSTLLEDLAGLSAPAKEATNEQHATATL
ncbi:MAG: hypothetical protein RH942_12030 [Kiloniellaceae bacterium]